MPLERKLKKKFLRALRDGSYTQCTGQLHSNGSFCALGVLHDVAGGRWNGEAAVFGEGQVAYCSEESLRVRLRRRRLPPRSPPRPRLLPLDPGFPVPVNEPYQPLYGLTNDEHHSIFTMNDSGKSFLELANWIEQNVESTD